MKIVVLGGAGDMGSAAVRDLLRFADVQLITIASRNTVALQKLASDLGNPRVAVRKVEAGSHTNLVEVMRGHDVAVGAVGPFYRFERPLVEAALAAGVDYVSICDDRDAVQSVLPLDREAVGKGRKILTGLGWTPGITNILARKGYDALENVEVIRVYWAGSAGDSEGLAVIMHTLHIFTGKAVTYRGGKSIEVKAGSGHEIINFPAPLGNINVFHLGHPEPVTLPLHLPGLREVTLKGGLAENYLNSLAKTMAALGLTSSPPRKQVLGAIMKKMLPFFPTAKNHNLSGVRVDIYGRRGGKKVRIIYTAVDPMSRLTGIPLSIGAAMLARGKVKRCGVFGPEAEGAIDPDHFLQELARRNVQVGCQETELPD